MNVTDIIRNKTILIVDDEPDVLESLIEILHSCRIDTAANFSDGHELLVSTDYDMVILDIMGVDGFDLLQAANARGIPALMLTANALDENNLKEAARKGAAYFVPKEKMSDIDLYIADVMTAVETRKNPWVKLFDRLGGFFDKKFHGTDWREKEKSFWKNKLRNKF
jgi:CheY-like chemotaxis protein